MSIESSIAVVEGDGICRMTGMVFRIRRPHPALSGAVSRPSTAKHSTLKRPLSVAEIRKGLSDKEVRSGGAYPKGDLSRRDKPLYRQDLAKIGRRQLPFQGRTLFKTLDFAAATSQPI